jgi:hypothetical protein
LPKASADWCFSLRSRNMKNFQQLFCAHFECKSEAYPRKLFWMCLYRRTLPVAGLIFWLSPKFFSRDFDLIEQLGVTQTQAEFQQEIDNHSYQIKAYGNLLQRAFQVRISGKRLIRLSRLFRESKRAYARTQES